MSQHDLPTATGLYRYFTRLLTLPLSGDGFLLVGFLEGVVGWPLSHLLARNPSLSPFGLFASIVGLWVLLTAVLVAVGRLRGPAGAAQRRLDRLGRPERRGRRRQRLALTGSLAPSLRVYGYWHPWMAVFGGGYLVTALSDWGDLQVRRPERVVYLAAGVASLAVLAVSFRTAVLVPYLFAVGGVLHLVPIGFDVGLDAVLFAGRAG